MGNINKYWNERPDISNVPPVSIEDTQDWLNWVGIVDDETRIKLQSDSYLITKIYVRIIPLSLVFLLLLSLLLFSLEL